MSESPAARRLHSPRLAVVVADHLRSRILSGQLTDGDRLPREDDLRAELGVGKPAMREAMRILEEEGLVTVLRGNRGGAVVHAPRPAAISYALGLALHDRRARASDVATALRHVEPACAALCALRADRQRTVVPALRRALEEGEDGSGDPAVLTAASRRFHETLVASCGNETLILVVGALEALWSAHVAASADGRVGRRDGVSANRRRSRGDDPPASLAEHTQIADLIEAGDAELARAVLTSHLNRVQGTPTRANTAGLIDMTALRSALSL